MALHQQQEEKKETVETRDVKRKETTVKGLVLRECGGYTYMDKFHWARG